MFTYGIPCDGVWLGKGSPEEGSDEYGVLEDLDAMAEGYDDKELAAVANKVWVTMMNGAHPLITLLNDDELWTWHARCVCHVLATAVNSFLSTFTVKKTQILSIYDRVHKNASTIRASTVVADRRVEMQVSLPLVCATRWSSGNAMLNGYRDADKKGFFNCKDVDELQNYIPVPKGHMNIIDEVINSLEAADEYTRIFQAPQAVAGDCMPYYDFMLQYLTDQESEMATHLRCLIEEQFEKHGVLKDRVYLYAGLTNPLQAAWVVGKLTGQRQAQKDTKKLFLKVLGHCATYIRNTQSQDAGGSQDSQDAGKKETKGEKKKWIFKKASASKMSGTVEEELESYIEDMRRLKKVGYDGTALSWWTARSADFPRIYELFKLVYWYPASSSSVERLFSVTGRICRAHRARLSPEHIEQLTLVKLPIP